MATLQLQDNQHCPLTIQAVDVVGNPSTLPSGSVTWTSANPAIATVVASADGMSADVSAVGPIGTVQIGVAVDLGGGQVLTGTLDVAVVAGQAATIQIVPGTPVAK